MEPILPLLLGSCEHKGMEYLFKKGSNLDAAIEAAWAEWDSGTKRALPKEGLFNPSYFIAEQKALIAAFLWAFRVQHWDSFNNRYEIVQIEEELETEVLPDAILQSRCDLVVRERESGLLFIPDWKVVKDARNWATKFERESQTWAQTFAVEAAMGEQVAGCIYFAFIKGDRRKDQQCSSLIYGYKNEIAPGVFEYDCETRRQKGWTKFAVWEEDFPGLGSNPTVLDRIRYWVNWLPEEVRAQQFCLSPPVLRDEPLIEEWTKSSARLMVSARARVSEGPGAFDAHREDYKCSGCFAEKVCYGRIGLEESGWSPREDHHKREG